MVFTRLETDSEVFRTNAAMMQREVRALKKNWLKLRLAALLLRGNAIRRSGKLLPRERLRLLLDPETIFLNSRRWPVWNYMTM